MASPEFDAALALTEWQRDKADWVKSMVNASELAAGYQARAEKAEAALAARETLAARIRALCEDAEDRRDWVRCADLRALLGTS